MAREALDQKDIQTRATNAVDYRPLAVKGHKSGPSIGLGILSWRGHLSLAASLQSYARADFFSLFDEALVFMPDPNEDVLSAVKPYPVRAETAQDNKGILEGMAEIAARINTDYIFFTENDCPLVESRDEAQKQIAKALQLLENGSAHMARMRHTRKYGEAFETIHKYRRYHPETDTISATIKRLIRPEKAKRLRGTAIYDTASAPLKFPASIVDAGDGFFLVNTDVMPWTNQSIIIKKDFFLNTILPYARSAKERRNANGFPNLEIELNRSTFWTKSGWKIACGAGILTHKRAEHRGY